MIKTLLNYYRIFLTTALMGTGIVTQAQYCLIGFSNGVEPITTVDFAGIVNNTQATGGTSYEDFTSLFLGNVIQGQSYTITVKGNTFGNYSDYIRVYFDWNQNSDFTDAGEFYNVGMITNSNGQDAVQASLSILIPYASNLGNIRMRVVKNYGSYITSPCNTAGWGQAEDYLVNISSGTSCSGTPGAGTAAAPASVCANSSFNLVLTGQTSASGITIQWEYDDGTGWIPLANATNPTYSVTGGIVIPTSYRAIVTCGSSQSISNVTPVSINLPTQCYCTISYPLAGGGPISLVNFGSINNATSASTTSPTYENFTGISETVQQGQSLLLIVKGNTVGNYTDSVRVFFDWDQNGSFSDPGESYDMGNLTNTTGLDAIQASIMISIPFTATLGATRMRVTKKYNMYSGPCNTTGYGQAEDYTINVVTSNTCIGTPNAGIASAVSTICPNTNFNLTLANYTIDAGILLQWQFYNTATNLWEDIPAANSAIYSVTGGITASTNYRTVVTCLTSSFSDTSNIITVTVSHFTSCYCIPSSSGTYSITNLKIINTTFNNTSGLGASPGYYTSFPPAGSATATLMEGANYSLEVSLNLQAAAGFWIDYDQNGTFDISEYTSIPTANAIGNVAFMVPYGVLPGQTGMRIRNRSGATAISNNNACTGFSSGETEDYIVTIIPAVYCAGNPVAGTISAPPAICPSTNFNLALQGYSIAPDITLQWEEDYGSGWSPIANATNALHTITTGITIPTNYRAIITCGTSSVQAIATPALVNVNNPNQCYCAISFPSGDVEPITLVDFAGINNPSSDTIGASPQSEDYTAIPGVVSQGASYPITVKGNTNGNYTDHIVVYIDWNQNGILNDPGENFSLGTITNSTGMDLVAATGTINVPTGLTTGPTRMRVTKKWSSAATACNNTGYGQSEDYTLHIDFPLAIKLTNITATNTGSKNRIDWMTSTEMRGDYFELEKSGNGTEFNKVATIIANGEASNYTYWDEVPFHGTTYYRLQMREDNGTHAYSKTVSAVMNSKGQAVISLYPNPTRDYITVKTEGQSGNNKVLNITDIAGRVIKTINSNSNTTEIDMSTLAEGVYLIHYTDDNYSQTIKVNKY